MNLSQEATNVLMFSQVLRVFLMHLYLCTSLVSPPGGAALSRYCFGLTPLGFLCAVQMGRRISRLPVGWLPVVSHDPRWSVQEVTAVRSDAVRRVYLICADSKRMFGWVKINQPFLLVR